MKNFFSNLIKLVLSIVILVFAEEYFFKLLGVFNINLNNNLYIYFILNILVAICLYIIYKDDLKSGFNRFKHKTGKNLIYTLIAFFILFICLYITNYICITVGKSFHVTYHELTYLNIFNQTLNLNLIITIIESAIIIPFIKVTIFDLGVNNLFDYKVGIVFSGLLAGCYNAYLIGGSISYMILNSIPVFILYTFLAFVYHKNNNIAFSIITYILYTLLAGTLVNIIM